MPELKRIETVVFLQSVDIFTDCKAEEVLRVAAITHERTFEAGADIYSPGDPADALFCIVRGEVRLVSDDETEVVGPLRTFGATGLLTGRRRRAAAVADSDTLVLMIDDEDFFDLLAHNIEIVRALFRTLLPTGERQ